MEASMLTALYQIIRHVAVSLVSVVSAILVAQINDWLGGACYPEPYDMS
jgi:hypothetical protein